jgi:GT2 family glycosyltransferase
MPHMRVQPSRVECDRKAWRESATTMPDRRSRDWTSSGEQQREKARFCKPATRPWQSYSSGASTMSPLGLDEIRHGGRTRSYKRRNPQPKSVLTTSVAVIIVSANNGQWLRPCLRTVFERAGEVDLDVVVVASGCTDETVPLVRHEFPHVRILECENRGFAYANNVALRTIDSDWVLFLNPDTEILEGTFEQLASLLRDRTEIGVAAVRQLTPEGNVFPTIRRFPNALRTLSEALGSERFPFRAAWLGERELDLRAYERETECDWTTGAFMFVRREALASVGLMDERFFLYCEEVDFCRRIRDAGWQILHLPQLTILHHAGRERWNPRLHAQLAFARRQYMEKHFSRAHRATALAALGLGYALRAVLGGSDDVSRSRRASARAALAALTGAALPPFGEPPGQAVTISSGNSPRPTDS